MGFAKRFHDYSMGPGWQSAKPAAMLFLGTMLFNKLLNAILGGSALIGKHADGSYFLGNHDGSLTAVGAAGYWGSMLSGYAVPLTMLIFFVFAVRSLLRRNREAKR